MKFQCHQCQASYQLADERVAGKILKIKCRKCATLIEVGDPALTGTPSPGQSGFPPSRSTPPPPVSGLPTAAITGGDEDDEETSIMKLPPSIHLPARAPAAKAAAPAGRAGPATSSARSGRTALGSMTFRSPASAPSAGGPPRPGLLSAPRPASAGAKQPAAAAVDASALAKLGGPGASVQDATLPSPGAGKAADSPAPSLPSKPLFPRAPGARTAAGSPLPKPAADPAGEPASPSPAPPGAAVPAAQVEAPAETSGAAAASWFVDIGGARQGPFDVSAIGEKLLSGVASGESLLWREGMADWQHLKNVPEFAELFQQAQKRTAPPASGVPSPADSAAADAGLFAGLAAPAAAEVLAAAAPSPPPSQAPLEVMADPFAAPPPEAPAALPAGAAAQDAPALPPDEAKPPGDVPAAAAGAASIDAGPLSAGTDSAVLSEPLPRAPRRRRGLPVMAYVFIALAAGFGGVGAWVLLTRQPPSPAKPQIVYVQTPAPAAATPEATAEAVGPEIPAGAETAGPGQDSTKPGVKGPLRVADTKSAASAGPSTPLDMSGFANTGIVGPSAQGPAAAGNAASAGQLSQGEMSGVVAQNMPLVRRRCWQPALDARANSGATSARVSASLTIAPSGSVQSVSASGAEKDFPGLASCIAARIRSWKFPASGGTTDVKVPFVFAGQ